MAKLTRLTSRDAVLLAIAEHDAIGRDAFLKKYGFRPARDYFVEHQERYYDSKPILAAAYGYEHPSEGPLRFNDFSGGEGVAIAFKRIKFEVTSTPITFLVLAENEVQADPRYDKWQDVTGERYHFPNGYRKRIRPGREFVYYKGARRNAGRAVPEYFGSGRIGSVYPDPTTLDSPASKRQWLCDIEDYRPFRKPVAFRDEHGQLLELKRAEAPESYWRNGVREISKQAFDSILTAAGEVVIRAADAPRPPIALSQVTPVEIEGGLELMVPVGRRKRGAGDGKAVITVANRTSRRAKEIGDRAEQVVLDWLRAKCANDEDALKIVWVANDGLTPGWDIEDQRGDKPYMAFEVKGTTGARFPAIEITANEWNAAQTYRGSYNLVLVTKCEAACPQILVIRDPWGLVQSGQLALTPMSFRIERVEQ